MKLFYNKKISDPTYYIQQGFRNGKKTTTRNVKRIGKHSELLKITDDPLAYAKNEVALYNERLKSDQLALEVKIDFNEKLKATTDITSSTTASNIGYFFLQNIYHSLDIKNFFSDITKNSRIKYDPNDINRFLTFARILWPESKLATYSHMNKFYEECEFAYEDIFKTMDLIWKHKNEYITHLFKKSDEIVERNTSVCYYDCTNFYFEIEKEDEDYVDKVTGETVKGLRKYGVSKEHRPNPIVEMGLFMDCQGIPLTVDITSGSDNETTTAIPLEKEMLSMFENKKIIYCADAGLGSEKIRIFNDMGGKAFIVTQSIKKLSDVLQEAVFNDVDYKFLSNDKSSSIKEMKEFDRFSSENINLYNDCIYKVLNADTLIDTGLYDEISLLNGKTKKVKAKATLHQQVIITFSRKAFEYQRSVRNRQIERAKKLLKSKNPEDIKKGPNDVKRFIKRKSSTKNGEKIIDNYYIDEELISREEKYDGFYAIATNLEDDVKKIYEINSQRYKIEECFRILKSNFDSRPEFCYKPQRIKAHFLICYTALLIYRLLEIKLNGTTNNFSVNNIIETLQNMNVVNERDLYYSSAYTNSKVLTALENTFQLGLDKQNYHPKDLNKKIKKIL